MGKFNKYNKKRTDAKGLIAVGIFLFIIVAIIYNFFKRVFGGKNSKVEGKKLDAEVSQNNEKTEDAIEKNENKEENKNNNSARNSKVIHPFTNDKKFPNQLKKQLKELNKNKKLI